VTALLDAARRVLWLAGWPARTLLIGLIRVYRMTLSGVLGGQCRFHPSCSDYAEGAIRNRGATVGAALAAWRILRCSPLSRGGIDPAPAGSRRAAMSAARPRASRVYESIIQSTKGVRP
jgi:putative membrane protein insertion efficiency factor